MPEQAQAYSSSHQRILSTVLLISLQPLSLREKLHKILSLLCGQTALQLSPRADIYLLDPLKRELHLEASLSPPKKISSQPSSIPYSQITLHNIAHQQTVAEEELHHYSLPLIQADEVLGVMNLYSTMTLTPQSELNTLTTVTTAIASMVKTEQLKALNNETTTAEERADLNENLSSTIIQTMSHALLVTNHRGQIVQSNEAANKLLQPFNHGLIGTQIKDIFATATTKNNIVTASGERKQILQLRPPEEGRPVYITCSSVATEFHPGQRGEVVSISDVSELLQTRRELEKINKLTTIAEIASTVAHEVRNPLAGIKVMAQSIEEEARNESETHECSKRIIRQVDRLNKLLSEFFSFAKPGKAQRRAISLRENLDETISLIKQNLEQKNIALRLDIPPELPALLADKSQIQQIFLNLFLNSIDAIQHGGTIHIEASSLKKNLLLHYRKKFADAKIEKESICVQFTDNGCGMPEKTLKKAFTPFFTTKESGTGLGLAIIQRTVKANNSSIFIESTPKRGTRFTLFFQRES